MTNLLDLEVSLAWQSRHARHLDRQIFTGVDANDDCVAGQSLQPLAQLPAGMSLRWAEHFFLGRRDPGQLRQTTLQGWRHARPRVGRHYPRGLLNEFPRSDLRPFRTIEVADTTVLADFNAPLRGIALAIDCKIITGRSDGPPLAPGGDLLEQMANDGPGMQAALATADTDFFFGAPWTRADETDDSRFYARERLVDHLDATTSDEIIRHYRRFLHPGMAVLDLMSSWNSHLPNDVDLTVTGLGMNTTELAQNPRLSARLVRDLNQAPDLPWPEATFDAALCALSIEYLTQPLAVVGEVGRVLKPGAPFVISFSDRWFPPKAIRLWGELHPFERLALVADYLRLSGQFENIQTESLRGLPAPAGEWRPKNRPFADPLFAVRGYRVSRR